LSHGVRNKIDSGPSIVPWIAAGAGLFAAAATVRSLLYEEQ